MGRPGARPRAPVFVLLFGLSCGTRLRKCRLTGAGVGLPTDLKNRGPRGVAYRPAVGEDVETIRVSDGAFRGALPGAAGIDLGSRCSSPSRMSDAHWTTSRPATTRRSARIRR